MELTNKTSNYTMYRDKLNTGEEFRIALSNTINSSVEINVKFNENFAIIEPNKCYISITNINEDKVKDVIMQTWKEIQKQLGIKNFSSQIKIIVNNEEDLNKANRIASNSGLRVMIEKSSEYQKMEQTKQNLDKFLKANTVTKNDNGKLKTYTERKADNSNIGYMLENITSEEMYRKLQELMSDSAKKNIYENMNEEELTNTVLDAIAREGNRKKYYLESARDQVATNKMGAVAGMVATQNEGIVNEEIGVVRNGSKKTDEINTVEQVGNRVNVVTPEVNTATVSNNTATVSNNSVFSYGFNHQSTNDYYDYNKGQDNYSQSLDNPNENIYEGEKQKREAIYPKKRILSKPNEHKSSGMVSLPIIIFIISGLLLIASAIIFFMSK